MSKLILEGIYDDGSPGGHPVAIQVDADGKIVLSSGLGSTTLLGLTDVAGSGAAGKAPIMTDATHFVLTDVATQAELDALAATTQPLDGDLTAIAGLTTTATGRNLLTIASAAAGRIALAAMMSLTPTAVKNLAASPYAAAAGDFVPVDTTAGNVQITFPTAPVDNALLAIKHVIQGGTNVVNLVLGGSDVFNKAGGAATGSLALSNQGIICLYKASSAIWYVIADDLSLSQLDLRFQPLDSDLTSIAALATAAFGRSLLTQATAAAARTTLAAGSAANQNLLLARTVTKR